MTCDSAYTAFRLIAEHELKVARIRAERAEPVNAAHWEQLAAEWQCVLDFAAHHRAEAYRAEAWRCEVHVGLTDDALAANACSSVYPAVTR